MMTEETQKAIKSYVDTFKELLDPTTMVVKVTRPNPTQININTLILEVILHRYALEEFTCAYSESVIKKTINRMQERQKLLARYIDTINSEPIFQDQRYLADVGDARWFEIKRYIDKLKEFLK